MIKSQERMDFYDKMKHTCTHGLPLAIYVDPGIIQENFSALIFKNS